MRSLQTSGLQLVVDVDRPGLAQQGSDDAEQLNAILLFPPDAKLPDGWQTPWVKSGWAVRKCRDPENLPAALAGPGTSALIAAPWPDAGQASSPAGVTRGLQAVIDRLGGSAAAVPAALPGGGVVRRGAFLAHLANVMSAPESGCRALMAIRLDQESALTARLDRAALFDLEERVCSRITSALRALDPVTIWLEFGFGVLIQRDTAAEVWELAGRLCAAVADEPFDVGGESCNLSVSVGLALAPRAQPGEGAHPWFAAAHAAQGIAKRHGGNCCKGLLTREFEPMPAERVLIIREWVQDAKSGSNVMIEFQPLVPMHAAGMELYSVHAKLRDQRAPLGGVYRDEYLHLAREAGAMVMIDRMSLFHAFETLEQERARGRKPRLLVNIDIATLDGLPWRWLEAELRRRRHLADGLILDLDAARILHEVDGVERMDRLREHGVHICVSDSSGNLRRAAALCKLPADLLRVPVRVLDAHAPQAVQTFLRHWRALGRQVIVDEIEDTSAVARLSDLAVDYLRGDALAAIGLRLDFEFNPGR